MTPIAKLSLILIAGLALVGCSGMDTDKLRGMQTPSGTPFNTALVNEYRAAAVYEATVEYEWDEADVFARKGLKAAAGELVQPDELSQWKIPDARKAELTQARSQLMAALNAGGRERTPQECAIAQVNLDGWMEEEAEGYTDSQNRKVFLETMPKCLPQQAAAPPAPTPPPAPRSFIVYFDLDKSVITQRAKAVIAEAAAAARTAGKVTLAGHADLSGKSAHNQALSERRNAAVRAALEAAGVPASKIAIDGAYGDRRPRVQTPRGKPLEENRRVEITLQ